LIFRHNFDLYFQCGILGRGLLSEQILLLQLLFDLYDKGIHDIDHRPAGHCGAGDGDDFVIDFFIVADFGQFKLTGRGALILCLVETVFNRDFIAEAQCLCARQHAETNQRLELGICAHDQSNFVGKSAAFGDKITIKNGFYQSQYKGTPAGKFTLTKIGDSKKIDNEIVAITGATVTSQAVVNIMNTYVVQIKQQLQQKNLLGQ